jgi:hypothetical protein
VAMLFSISRPTVWRWSRSGHLPPPVHINGVTLWNVGALRERMPPTSTSAAQLQSEAGQVNPDQ